MRNNYDIVLSIAGSDSSAGAGIQADIKSVAACGGYCATAITALTAQNTCGVESVNIVSDDIVRAQIDAVMVDLRVKAIKLGMLPSVGIVATVKEYIERYGIENVVLDPVMISTSGCTLVEDCVSRDIITKLLPLTRVITPNIPECEFICGIKITCESDFENAAHYFKKMGTRALLLKSGHLTCDMITDNLYDFETGEIHKFRYNKVNTINTHGTGCSLSSSLAAHLAQGYSLMESVRLSEEYIHGAIESAICYEVGKGHGPINHFYKYDKI